MNIVIRVDASLQIGTGHLMRCLTLADALQKQGAEVSFISRALKGNLIQHIEDKGYVVYRLDSLFSEIENLTQLDANSLPHERWLGATQEEDAEACQPILEQISPEWLIVDHYAIDYRWQLLLKKFYNKLMVIDDLSDRKHVCDLLLDQTFNRKETDYKSLVPHNCQLLLGSKYALLRPEFVRWREYSLQRRTTPILKNILISMGGVDENNVTGQILQELKTCNLSEELTITVVIGTTSPNIGEIKKIAASMPNATEVKVSVDNMAELMAKADLAIGAAGSTTWERCCLGLPCIHIVIADNQKLIARNLKKANIVEYIENLSDLKLMLKYMVKKLKKISILSSAITNGNGCTIIINELLSQTIVSEEISLKPIADDDCKYIYDLQTDAVRKYSRNPAKPTWDEHVKWFSKYMQNEFSVIFIILLNQQSVGVLRLDNIADKEIEVSIIVDPCYSGRSIAKKSLMQAFKLHIGEAYKAVIHKENIPSQKVFEKTGFNKVGESDCFFQYIKSSY